MSRLWRTLRPAARMCVSLSVALAVAVGLAPTSLTTAAPAQAAITVVYVNDDATGANNGSSWANAYTSLQSALAAAISGNEVWVAAGTYRPGTTFSDAFQLKNGVAVYGGFAGSETERGQRDWAAHRTILSGDIDNNDVVDANGVTTTFNGTNARHVVIGDSTDSTAVLDGFTVTGGNYPSSGGSGFGAGIYLATGGSGSFSNLIIGGNAVGNYGYGGGMATTGSSPALRNVTFTKNVGDHGGGLSASGSPTLTNVVFSGNAAAGTYGDGGAIYVSGNPVLANVVMSGNTALWGGAMMVESGSSPALTNVTISGNKASDTAGGVFVYGGSVTLTNSIVWGNTAPFNPQVYLNSGTSAVIRYSDVQSGCSSVSGATCGAGNINANPLFETTVPTSPMPNTGGNLRLTSGSPATDAGINSDVLTGVTADLAGQPRFRDDTGTPDTGVGTPPIVDMGAYEFQGTSVPPAAPTVSSPTSATITDTAATLGGEVTSAGTTALTEVGIVYAPTATNNNPTIGGAGVTKVMASSASTGVFTLPVNGLTPSTGYSFKAYAINSVGTSYSSVATFTTTATPTNPTGVGMATPSTVARGRSTLLTVAVTQGANPTSTGLTASADLSGIGGLASQPFYDDGTHGDVTSGDHTFSFSATVASGTSTGSKSLPFTITDAQSRSGASSISLTVTATAVIYVNDDATGANNGSSWTNAYTSLQTALAAANPAAGDTVQIWVAAGTYKPASGTDRTASFVMKERVGIYGGFAGSEIALGERNADPASNGTILSGDLGTAGNAADNSYHVVRTQTVGVGVPGLTSSAVLDGLTITGGNANGSYQDNWEFGGGGMWLHQGSPTLANLRFEDNRAIDGGGAMFIHSTNGLFLESRETKPSLTNVAFLGNSAISASGTGMPGGGMLIGARGQLADANLNPSLSQVSFSNNSAGSGGGLYIASALATLTEVTFSNNTADAGGGIDVSGTSSASLTRALFEGNTAQSGGGMYLNGGSVSVTLIDSAFLHNQATGSLASNGGGLKSDSAAVSIVNGIFHGNTTSRQGGALSLSGTRTTLANLTVTGNTADRGGAVAITDGAPTLKNSIVWGNTAVEPFYLGSGGGLSLVNSLAQGGCPSGVGCTGVISGDPLFAGAADPGGADNVLFTSDDGLRVTAGSPAIDAGNNELVPSGVTTDIAGQNRFWDDTGTPNTGAGTPPVDMGAYEFQGTTNTSPQVDAGADASATAGGTFSRSGTFTDPNADSWSATVNYGEAGGTAVPLALSPDKSFALSHVYTTAGTYTVTVSVSDGTAIGTDTVQVTVTPANTIPVVNAGADATINEGATFSQSGAFSDPDVGDAWTATVDYGDGGGAVALILNADKSFTLSHLYADNGSYTIYVKVIDSHSATGTETVQMTVNNVAPVVNAGADASINAGGTFSQVGSFTDPGADSWSATVNYGEAGGTAVPLALSPDKSFALSHLYAAAGAYTVTVVVTETDLEAASSSDTVMVTVNTVPSVSAGGADATIEEGATFSQAGAFTDPDTGDAWTATVDYGDGGGAVALPYNNADKSFTLSHLYADNGPYTVSVAVTDSHTAKGTDTVQVTVVNKPPVVEDLADVSIAPNYTISQAGSFTDPGADSWTATVDYGDGGGAVPLNLTGQTFNLSHGYGSTGIYTVTVKVTDDDGDVGADTFKVTVAYVVAPNDDVTKAIVIGNVYQSFVYDTTQATADTGGTADPTNCYSTVRSVWFEWVAPPGSAGWIAGAHTMGTDYDTAVGVYTGTSGNLTRVTCNNDVAGFPTPGETFSLVMFTPTPGTTYYFMVSDAASTPAGGILNFLLVGQPPDHATTTVVADAIVTAGTTDQTVTLAATVSAGAGNPVPSGGSVSFTIANASGTVIGTPPYPVDVDASGRAQASYTIPGGTPAGSYTITAVFGGGANFVSQIIFGGSSGSGSLTITQPPQAPTVSTPTVTNVTDKAAMLGGNVTSAGTTSLTEVGVVYAVTTTNGDPSIGGAGVTKVMASSANTGVFTLPVSGLTPSTGYSFKAYAANGVGTSYSSVATFTTTVTPTNPTGVGTANPGTVAVGGSTLLTVAVTPGTNPPSTGPAVTADLRPVGGSSTQPFYDDGTHGDVTAGDSTFSFLATIVSGTSTGGKTLSFTVTDAQSRSGTGSITLLVTIGGSRATTTTLTSSVNPSVSGQSVTLTAQVRPANGSGKTSGTITFLDGATVLASMKLPGNGTANFTTPALAVGNHQLAAEYGGDPNFAPSLSVALSQTVGRAATTTALTVSATTVAVGDPLTFTATVQAMAPGSGPPSGIVSFVEGGITLGTGSLSGAGVATFSTSTLSVGAHSLVARYDDDASFAGSTSSSATVTVTGTPPARADTTSALASSNNPSVTGQIITLQATVTGAGGSTIVPTGTVTFAEGSTTLGTGALSPAGVASYTTGALTPGTHAITATYGGDTSFAPSVSAPLSQVVKPADTTTALTVTPNPAAADQTVTLTATVVAPKPGGGTTSGTVEFRDGATILSTGTLSGGVATYTTTFTAGTHTLVAVYEGEASFNGSTSSSVSLTVEATMATTVTLATSANPASSGQPVTFTATVGPVSGSGTPAGTVTFMNGAKVLGTATLNGGVATFTTAKGDLKAGVNSITAIYSGNASFSASTSAALSQSVIR